VIHAAFVFQIQPLSPDLPCLVVYAQPKPDGKATREQLTLRKDFKGMSGKARIAIGAFVTDGHNGFDEAHDTQHRANLD
jgi:hypothetical protein